MTNSEGRTAVRLHPVTLVARWLAACLLAALQHCDVHNLTLQDAVVHILATADFFTLATQRLPSPHLCATICVEKQV